MVIQQGEIYWVDSDVPAGSEPGYRHPYVIVQNSGFNNSRVRTVIACALSSNVRLAAVPGNVLLDRGEANLPRQSVVNVSQLITVDKAFLEERIGTLSARRTRQVLEGIGLWLEQDAP